MDPVGSATVLDTQAPQGAPPSKILTEKEANLLDKIKTIGLQLEQTEERKCEIELDNERLKKALEEQTKLTQSVITTAKAIIGGTCIPLLDTTTPLKGSDRNYTLRLELDGAMETLQKAEVSSNEIERSTKPVEEQQKPINPLDAHYDEMERAKKALLEVFQKLKLTSTNTIPTIIGSLADLRGSFESIRERLVNSKTAISLYVKGTRKFIDYLEANPIVSTNNPPIAQYQIMEDRDMIDRLQYDVCNIEELVKTKSTKVEKQVSINDKTNAELKARHDKFLNQYIEVESLLQTIELRLQKFSHYIQDHPSMLKLKNESFEFKGRLDGLSVLVDAKKTTIINLLKMVLGFIVEYTGQNPIKDEKYIDKDFNHKIKILEKSLGENFQADSEFLGYVNGTVTLLPEDNLLARAQKMKTTLAEATQKLNKLLSFYDPTIMGITIFDCMKFYDSAQQTKVKSREETYFRDELREVSNLLAEFNGGLKQIEELYMTTIPSMNLVISGVVTKGGNSRWAITYGLKGYITDNTQYLPPLK